MTGESFSFSEENLAEAGRIIARYPEGRQASAVLPLLDLAQRQSGDGQIGGRKQNGAGFFRQLFSEGFCY